MSCTFGRECDEPHRSRAQLAAAAPNFRVRFNETIPSANFTEFGSLRTLVCNARSPGISFRVPNVNIKTVISLRAGLKDAYMVTVLLEMLTSN